MNIDGAEDEEEVDEVAQAKAAARALARSSGVVDDIADGLRELNMDAYDDEEGSTFLSCASLSPSVQVCLTCVLW
jgi:hypothetical protein